MKQGFFTPDQVTQKVHLPLLPQCGKCGLHKQCLSPKMEVFGRGAKGILIVGEAPGKTEDIQGRPFCGKSGKYLKSVLEKCGIRMEADCWILNSLACHPKNDAYPPRATDYCRPNVISAIRDLKPRIILLLGKYAVKSVIGWLWKEDVGEIGRWIGWHVPCQRINAWVCPTWHPAFVIRNDYGLSGKDRGAGNEVREAIFERMIHDAAKIEGRPWDVVPDYSREVQVILDDDGASRMIRLFMAAGDPNAFDFETNMLKPDSEQARIFCCSLSNGISTIAFPWHGKAREMAGKLFQSDVPLISHNLQFEERWLLKEFGRGAKNMVWDTMLNTHILDNRAGICSLKFQSFVQLGQESYDDLIKPYLTSDGSNTPNRIHEADVRAVLKYCGMDSRLTWEIARIQSEKLRIKI